MSNTVGSQEIIPKVLYARKNLILNLTQEEFDILVGSVIGDGYITKKGRVQIEQGENQQEYLEWKFQKLRHVVSTSILCTKRKRYTGKITISYRFWSKQYFRPWRNVFYPEGKKIIPKKGLIFSPLLLAVWYMDDGYLRKKDSIAISTDNFTRCDLKRICEILERNYEVKPNIVKSGKLYFGKVATKKLVKIIQPFIISSMCYKLP